MLDGTNKPRPSFLSPRRAAQGVTGFHMGLLDPDTLEQKDVVSLAETVARYALNPRYRPFPGLVAGMCT